jgi:predicted regulator of Ras-like GTPase activity (Roadblock/LC7/MglB family)
MDQTVYGHLKTLHNKTGAHYVVLLNSEGYPLQVVGYADQVKVTRIASFVAANFLAVTELASLLGDNTSVFKSSYHEGSSYNIYAYDVNSKLLLAVVFGTAGKPGAVWFYTKQTATTLASLFGQTNQDTAANGLDAAIATEFDDLLGDEKDGG